MNANTTMSGLTSIALMVSDIFLPAYLLPFRQIIEGFGGLYSSLLIPAILLFTIWRTFSSTIWRFFIVSVEIPSEDCLYHRLQQWSESQAGRTNQLLAHTRMLNFDRDDISSKKRFGVQYSPAGKCTLYHQGKRIWYSRQREVRGNVVLESISLEEISGSNGINNLLQEICQSENEQMSIFRPSRAEVRQRGGTPWRHVSSRTIRPIESVALDKRVKDMVLNDIKKFLESEEWYLNVGIPYRRGMLLKGPPGTGKTSLSCALAGHFGLNMYCAMLGDAGLTDDDLFELLNCLPKRCIVVLEDIDCAQLGRRDVEGSSTHISEKKITLSGLLNAIDGPASSEGRILIMTTNHEEQLDPALLRPGRVDITFQFSLATKDQMKSIFLYNYSAEQIPNLEELAGRVVVELPDHTFSPAQFQGFLLGHKSDPKGAVEAVAGWKEEMLAKVVSV